MADNDYFGGFGGGDALANALRLAMAPNRLAGGQMDTQDVIGAIPKPPPSAGLLEALRDRAMRGDSGASGLVAQHDQAKASAPWFSSEGLAASKPNALGAALSNVPSELMFLSNFVGPKAPRIPNPIKAYHGSPHDFDKFDLSKIGTGEGAQAYGHGLYFAENENVAQAYKGAGPLQQWSALDPPKVNGKMYEVAIHATPDQFLDWDKPLSQQSEAVRKAADAILAEKAGKEITPEFYGSFGESGQGIHNLLSAWSKHKPEAAAQALRERGVAGIEYLDQGSRTGPMAQGTKNRVVFDPNLIEILRKYGLLGPVAAGATANALMGDKDSQ